MALIDEFDGGEFDLSQIPGFESLADQVKTQDDDEDDEDEEDDGDESENEDGETEAKGSKVSNKNTVSKKDYETLKSQFDELNGRIKTLTERAPQPQQIIYQQPAQPQITQQQADAWKAKLEQDFYSDPIGTNQRIAAAAAQQQFGGVVADMRESLAQQAIQNYRQNLMQDPQFAKSAVEHFDTQIASLPRGALQTLTPQKLNELLAFAEDAAWGKVMKKVLSKQQKPAAVSGRSTGPQPTPGSQNRQRQTPTPSGKDHESQLAKALGLTKSDFDGIVE